MCDMISETDRRPTSAGKPSEDTATDDPEPLSPDDIFHILQTNRRRDAIGYLLDRDGPVKMRDIAEYVAAKEHETTVAELTSTQRQRVYIPLYQSHLPKLDKKGVIEYDKSRGIVRPTDRLEIFRPFLEATGERPDSAASDGFDALDLAIGAPHAAVVGVSVGLLAATVSGLLAIPELALATGITLLFVLATFATNLASAPSTNDTGNDRLPRRRNGECR